MSLALVENGELSVLLGISLFFGILIGFMIGALYEKARMARSVEDITRLLEARHRQLIRDEAGMKGK